MKYRLTKLQILEYALEGIRTAIGSHPAPNDYPEELEELEAHEASVMSRIKLTEMALSRLEVASRRTSAVIISIDQGNRSRTCN